MFKIIYVITMAVAFTNMFNGVITPFYIKYIIATIWILLWIFDILIIKKKIEKGSLITIKNYCTPFILIMIWSLMIWIIKRPEIFSFEYVTRMFSNTIYTLLTFMSAIAGVHFFGKNTIKLSVWAMVLSILANLLYVISQYGLGMFLSYLPNVFNTTNYPWGSIQYNFALALEVQDITMATGFYLIYFLFFDLEDKKKTKIGYAIIVFICAYIGFKRTTLVGLFLVSGVIWISKCKKNNFSRIIKIIGAVFIAGSTIYIIIVKLGVLEMITTLLNIDANGRMGIYGVLSTYYELNPLFLGNGFLYVDKSMYESIGFVAHSVIVKMYAEIGFFPFFIWIIHYLIKIPCSILIRNGEIEGKLAFITTLYLFTTYFMENTMSLFCVQYSFIMIPLAMSFGNKKKIEVCKLKY
ncbi:hypothetical protein [Clostridium culturomicium]|uniref:hypothetical protein n=1 Tax=Clostridium culturomicium TaxID=1499683 RepID=UPI00385793E7